MNQEIFATYILPILGTALAALFGFFGKQLKQLYQKYVNDKTKEAVVRTCVKAAEQLYHDLSGPEKLKKAKEGILEMLEEKGIPISDLELNLLIESCVSEFNYGFGLKEKESANFAHIFEEMYKKEEPETEDALIYSEEGGGK